MRVGGRGILSRDSGKDLTHDMLSRLAGAGHLDCAGARCSFSRGCVGYLQLGGLAEKGFPAGKIKGEKAE